MWSDWILGKLLVVPQVFRKSCEHNLMLAGECLSAKQPFFLTNKWLQHIINEVEVEVLVMDSVLLALHGPRRGLGLYHSWG